LRDLDTDVKVSFIISHGAQKYLRHIDFYCGENGKCILNDRILDQKLRYFPEKLKNQLISKLKTDFTER
jgi:hypothetical protein